MMSVLSLYESSFNVSSSAIASSNALREKMVNNTIGQSHVIASHSRSCQTAKLISVNTKPRKRPVAQNL